MESHSDLQRSFDDFLYEIYRRPKDHEQLQNLKTTILHNSCNHNTIVTEQCEENGFYKITIINCNLKLSQVVNVKCNSEEKQLIKHVQYMKKLCHICSPRKETIKPTAIVHPLN